MNTTRTLLTALALSLPLADAKAQQWTTNNLPAGAIAWWSGDGHYSDLVGTNHGVPHSGGFTPGKMGQAFYFDGASFVEVPNFLRAHTNFSFVFWMRVDAFTDDYYMGPFGQGNGDANPAEYDGFFFYSSPNESSFGLEGFWADGSHIEMRAAMTFGLGVWKHVALTYDGATLRQFVDGSPLNSAADPGQTLGNTYPFRLGHTFALPFEGFETHYFQGALDEFGVFNRALSESEIAYLHHGPPAPRTVFDVALDFSTNSNPNSVWTYGYATSLGGSLILYSDFGNSSGLLYWQNNLSLGAPSTVRNPTTNTITPGSPVFGPGQAAFHPGPNGEYSVFRFTAPASGLYRLESSFFGSDTSGTSTDMHVLLNNLAVFNGTVSGFGPDSGPAFNTNLVLAAGDRVDFAVGFGNGSFFNDTTGINARFIFGMGELRLMQTASVGTNFTFSFQTVSNLNYTVEYNDDLRTTNWLFLKMLTGDGSLLPCLVPMTNGPQRFFRVRQP